MSRIITIWILFACISTSLSAQTTYFNKLFDDNGGLEGLKGIVEAHDGSISNSFDIIKMGKFTDQVQYGWINGGGVPFNIFTKNGKITLSKF